MILLIGCEWVYGVALSPSGDCVPVIIATIILIDYDELTRKSSHITRAFSLSALLPVSFFCFLLLTFALGSLCACCLSFDWLQGYGEGLVPRIFRFVARSFARFVARFVVHSEACIECKRTFLMFYFSVTHSLRPVAFSLCVCPFRVILQVDRSRESPSVDFSITVQNMPF